MKRYRQSLEEVLSMLSPVDTTWMDDHSAAVVEAFDHLGKFTNFTGDDVIDFLQNQFDFDVGVTTIRLVLGLSKDEFTLKTNEYFAGTPLGFSQTRLKKDPKSCVDALIAFGFFDELKLLTSRQITWKDLLTERLRSGRGSAIKGQKRGRGLEDITEEIVKSVFGSEFDSRCQFVGANGQSVEKCDFAIPNKEDARILIECKAYGATGSKQTDVIGDIAKIVAQKRADTHLLLVTDGPSWLLRQSDLQKLIEWQNTGKISRIYTQKMAELLKEELQQLKDEHSL